MAPAAGSHAVLASEGGRSQAPLPSALALIRMKQSAPAAAASSFAKGIVIRTRALEISNPLLGGLVPDLDRLAVEMEAVSPPLPQLSAPSLLFLESPLPTARPALPVNRLPENFCDPVPMTPRPAIATSLKRPIRPGSPDIFGSVALAVSRTTLDDKWLPVADAGLPRRGPWSALVASARSLDRSAQIAAVNSWVNARIGYVEDSRQYGTIDYWASAAQSLTRGRGDCEDYAIAKMQILRALGVPTGSMYLVIARDLVRRIDHAVLAVALDGDLMVLDNETDRILSSTELKDYKPLLSFNATRRWTHGYAIDAPAAPVRYTAMNAAPPRLSALP